MFEVMKVMKIQYSMLIQYFLYYINFIFKMWFVTVCSTGPLICLYLCGGDSCTVRQFNRWRYCLALCDEMFDHFPLFDEILRHIELCDSVIRHIQWNLYQRFSNGVDSSNDGHLSLVWASCTLNIYKNVLAKIFLNSSLFCTVQIIIYIHKYIWLWKLFNI